MFNEVSVRNIMRHCFLMAADVSNFATNEKELEWIAFREECIDSLIDEHKQYGNTVCYNGYPCECKVHEED